MEEIINATNILYPNLKIKFSTVAEYLKSIHREDLNLEVYEADFLPY